MTTPVMPAYNMALANPAGICGGGGNRANEHERAAHKVHEADQD